MAYGVHRGMTDILNRANEDGFSVASPSASIISRYPMQPEHGTGGGESQSRPYRLCAKSLLGLRWTPAGECTAGSRRKKMTTPDEQKDSSYWVKRRKNNEAARRSRQRRRAGEIQLETRTVELIRENEKLREKLSAVQSGFTPAMNQLQIPLNSFVNHNNFLYPATNLPLIHDCKVSKNPFNNRSAYFSNSLAPPYSDLYQNVSFNAASNNPVITCSGITSALGCPPASLQNNDYSCSRSPAAHREVSGHQSVNYAPGAFVFKEGCELFKDVRKTYPHYQVPVSRNQLYSYSCEQDAHGKHEQNFNSNQTGAHTWRECCMVHLTSRESKAEDRPARREQQSGHNVRFLPHKLRFKSSFAEPAGHHVSPRVQEAAVGEISSMSRTDAPCLENVREVARNTSHVLNTRKPHFPEITQGNAPRGFSSCLESSDGAVTATDEFENTKTLVPQSGDMCVFSTVGQLTSNGIGHYGNLCKGTQNTFALGYEKEVVDGGLRNQLESLGAEVKYLKQMVLAKSTI